MPLWHLVHVQVHVAAMFKIVFNNFVQYKYNLYTTKILLKSKYNGSESIKDSNLCKIQYSNILEIIGLNVIAR